QACAELVQNPDILTKSDTLPSEVVARLQNVPESALQAARYLLDDTAKNTLEHYMTDWRNVKIVTTGNTLREMGIPPSPRYKHLLQRLRDARLDGDIKSDLEEATYLDDLLRGGYGL
ncbi:MAG: hypothetical protein ACPG7F_04575, partial [Aggregatilineales bacterium]